MPRKPGDLSHCMGQVVQEVQADHHHWDHLLGLEDCIVLVDLDSRLLHLLMLSSMMRKTKGLKSG